MSTALAAGLPLEQVEWAHTMDDVHAASLQTGCFSHEDGGDHASQVDEKKGTLKPFQADKPLKQVQPSL